MNYLIFDLIIAAVLIAFALWGRHRGLILSIFSLVALLVAIFGGLFVSKQLTPVVTEWTLPAVEKHVIPMIQSVLPEDAEDAIQTSSSEEKNQFFENLSPETVQDYLDNYGIELPAPVHDFLMQMDEEDLFDLVDSSTVEELATTFTGKVISAVLRVVLFLLCFVLILILWNVLARALDLVSRLPGLNAMNKLGGFLFGLLRGALFLFVAAWLLKCYPSALNALVSPETVEQTYLLEFFLTVKPMELLASL